MITPAAQENVIVQPDELQNNKAQQRLEIKFLLLYDILVCNNFNNLIMLTRQNLTWNLLLKGSFLS
jgi:hypothetical protein